MGIVKRLVALLNHPSPQVLTPALRTVGNIATVCASSLVLLGELCLKQSTPECDLFVRSLLYCTLLPFRSENHLGVHEVNTPGLM